MKRLLVVLILAAGCAGQVPIPKQIPDALNQACDVYSKAKPQVIAARQFAIAHWNDKVPGTDKDLIPADVKATLTDLDSYLPKLDAAGLEICAAAEAATVARSNVNWNEVLTVVLKGVNVALDLKAKGAI